MHVAPFLYLLAALCLLGSPLAAQEPPASAPAEEAAAAAEPPPPEPVPPDRIATRSGSVILGEVVHMTGGVLSVKTAFGAGEVVQVKWPEVSELETHRSLPFVLKHGTVILGLAAPAGSGRIRLSGAELEAPAVVALEAVTAINPPEVKPVRFKGTVNFGGSITSGNTQTRTASFLTDFEARTARQRLTIGAAWNYADDEDGLTSRNTRGNIKYDLFFSERFYLFAGALFEEDKFQDLNLRTALSGGPGYQWIKAGDFEAAWLEGLELSGEAGLSFFNEDFRSSPDQRYVAARWSARLNWPLVKGVSLFHRHQGYPGLERGEDLYVATEQGVRFDLWSGLVATLQVNWRWDNTPSPGFERQDIQYLMTLGYAFEF